jgi:hypothetical protein
MPQPVKMPKASAPAAPKPIQQPMSMMPQPISKPMQQTFTPSPNILKQPVNPTQVTPPSPQMAEPIVPNFGKSPYSLIQDDYNQMQNVQSLPQSLQPISQPDMMEQSKPKFNQLSGLLNKGMQK